MFESLSEKLQKTLRNLRGLGKLSEKNMKDGLRDVRMALLEADVNYKVVKDFIGHVQDKALGREVLESITPGQQLVKVVYDELVRMMGKEAEPLRLSSEPPTVIMLIGLQGSGKTTTAAKLARSLRTRGHQPLLVAADVYRPAAVQQLIVLSEQLGIPAYSDENSNDPVGICRDSVQHARRSNRDVLILDTAGRLHINDELIEELRRIREILHPHEVLLVADAMTGQDAVNVAEQFHSRVGITGVILTKLDGDARGGAALSIKSVTGQPIKFAGIGEKLDAFEVFHPDRVASRILGMGDVLSLVEKAQGTIDEKRAAELQEKLLKAQFTLEDFQQQLQQLKKMGPLDEIMAMIPGMSKFKGLQPQEQDVVRVEAIINSMTKKERQLPTIIDGSRKKRIARGSGTAVADVNRLLKQFQQMQKMMKQVRRMGRLRGLGGGLNFPV
ncbi:MAG: signal recognition particle protein [Candidatus Abyssobacteria bacterium SURF_17]|uniref:Signal recognition particle protein n=1 Tax=Candidatus Abyssobacteria bacterium SURF_17 TaxID=2093361 RepID=A0A419F8H9_9BACT|nr:MAG: signal recognition particle protein [Candidatus Abyssubacteria bacterium SURF_17]